MAPPRTRYARSGDVSIAFQEIGEGSVDLVSIPGWVSHLDFAWEDPAQARFLERLSSFSRLVRFDKRGTGLSDPVATVPTLEQRVEDLSAVMDAAGLDRAALFGHSDGAQIGLMFAATYPDRTSALIINGGRARATSAPGYPWGHPEIVEGFKDAVDHWGEGRSALIFSPGTTVDRRQMDTAARWERMCASPAMARTLQEANREMDIRGILPAIRVPTLVLHRTDDPIPIGGGRYIADHAPGARFVELQGSDHAPWLGDADAVLGEIESFLTGARHSYDADRILATVLFTDIVASTEHAARLGDRRWRELLMDHDRLIRERLERARGRVIKHTGDGFLATFDGPARSVRCAMEIRDDVRRLGIEIRAGLHTGECEVVGDDVGGIAVHIGQRVSSLAQSNEILVSSTVKDLVVGSGLQFEDRGLHTLKGVPDQWRIFRVVA